MSVPYLIHTHAHYASPRNDPPTPAPAPRLASSRPAPRKRLKAGDDMAQHSTAQHGTENEPPGREEKSKLETLCRQSVSQTVRRKGQGPGVMCISGAAQHRTGQDCTVLAL